MKNLVALALIFWSSFLYTTAQTDDPSQTIKGVVVDKDSRQPLIGAIVYVSNLEDSPNATTDIDGSFRIEGVPVGRRDIVCEYLGYEPFVLKGLILNSAKELEVNIEMVESLLTATDSVATVTAFSKTNRPLNEVNIISSRSFSVEEAKKYPGSIADPSRMALGFAGVQMGQDNNNDILVRGNSSVGVSWRLEGVEIANPNHFSRMGSSGGGISAFSGSVLSNSDFSTGAFAPEYGNAMSSVFDMKFRKGNRDKREYTIRAGLLGLDFSTEGPFKKGGASYLFNYRYSTLGILNAFGLHVVDARTTNNFQDLSFNLYFPSKNNKTFVQLWGIGGLSKEVKEPDMANEWTLYDQQTRYDFISNMGTAGLSVMRLIGGDAYIKSIFSVSANKTTWDRDSVTNELIASPIEQDSYLNGRYDLTTFLSKKINSKVNFKTGLTIKNVFYDLRRGYHDFGTGTFVNDLSSKGHTWQLQYYAQTRYRPTGKLTIVAGLHSLFLSLNNSFSVEPRLAMKYRVAERASLSLAYGMHSQVVPIGTYFIENPSGNFPNKNLDLLKAHHLVLSYEQSFKNNVRLNIETYFQHLYNIPVEGGGSTFWMLNTLEGYGRPFSNTPLQSDGAGRNIGVDATFEKYMSNNLFFLISGSLYQSTYTVDGAERLSTRYDGRYSSSVMMGKEFTLKKNNAITFSFRHFYNGGLRYTPGDAAASAEQGDLVEDESRAFAERMKNYWRIDLQLAYRKDKPKYAWSLILDTQNVVNYDNQRELIYDYKLNNFIFKKQSGFVPVLSFQVDF